MKKLLIATLLILPILTIAQKIGKFGELPKGKNRFDLYITKSGDTLSVGDNITIGMPSSDNGFNFITQGGVKSAVFLSDRTIEIYRIRTFRDKRFAKRAFVQFKGYGMLPVDIDYELALKRGEIEDPFSDNSEN